MKNIILNFSQPKVFLVLALISTLAAFATPRPSEAQTLTSYLSGTTSRGHVLTFKNAGLATWTFSDFAPCSKFPCDVKDQTTETTLKARWMSPIGVADGDTVIGLSNGMTVTYINNGMAPPNPDGSRMPSYWQLEIPSTTGGQTEIIRLNFVPKIE